MPWAITPKRVGRPVGARRIRRGWALTEWERFTVEVFSSELVLAEDERSLREPTDQEKREMLAEQSPAPSDLEVLCERFAALPNSDMSGLENVLDRARAKRRRQDPANHDASDWPPAPANAAAGAQR